MKQRIAMVLAAVAFGQGLSPANAGSLPTVIGG
jgi:hypothetical protein